MRRVDDFLGPDTVHLWHANLHPPGQAVACFEATLSSEERARAARLVFERDRTRFVVARGVLRSILGAYLEADPRQIVIQAGPHGKPELADKHAHELLFNISHSGRLGLFAFARRLPVGVDLEHVRPLPYIEELAASVLGDQELAEFQALPPQDRIPAFLTAWTRKEAVLKSLGCGMSISPREIEVTLSPGPSAATHRPRGQAEVEVFSVLAPRVPPGYFGALALKTTGVRLVERAWDTEAVSG